MKDFILAVVSVISSLFLVLLIVSLGWYLVWKLFLSRFRFVRELIGGGSENLKVEELKTNRLKVKKSRKE